MTSMTPMTRTATFRARDGRRAQLAERLLHAASLMAAVPGCELWLVQRDLDDADMIRVTEMWASRQHCDAALNLPGVDKNAAQVMGLLDRPPEVADGEPRGRARMLRGSTGATAFSILDAPDLSKDTQLLERYDLDDVGEARGLAPASARELEAGPNGLEVLAFGSHSPGDGELVADWWTT
jgi:quinol monooxygenase YgiN